VSAFITYLSSPIGTLEISGSDEGIERILFTDPVRQPLRADHPLAVRCGVELNEYFGGERIGFTLPLAPRGTAFQQRVWEELVKIPFGKTCTYTDIAVAVGNAKTIRAVGNANGRNPIAIVIPCHRIIGSDGSLTGYAGGLWRKGWLLEHEGASDVLQLFSS
jgi:methylated-DNA-[protein]-cysteine S-methyltransferase